MEQLILHLFGDYILQTNWMAKKKRRHAFPAAVHALVYGLLFLMLQPSLLAWTVIVVSHFFIDWLGLARYVLYAKNWITEPSLKWYECEDTGYPVDMPAWMAVWLYIIADNTLHLAINYAALRWL